MRSKIKEFTSDQRGGTAIEYALIAALVAVGLILTIQMIGLEISNMYEVIALSMEVDPQSPEDFEGNLP